MYKYEVGKPLQKGVTQYPEGVHFNFGPDGASLLIFMDNPTQSEIKSVKTGKAKLGLFVKENVIFFLSKFGTMNWVDAPYTVHRSAPFEFEDVEDKKYWFPINSYSR